MSSSDYELALRLQNEINGNFNDVPAKRPRKEGTSIVDADWEKSDPNPDIYILFQTFDKKFFWSKLESVEVKWSKRMYSCAGVCTYKGKRGGVCISLSLPLLQLRPRKDLVETLLHEMIHAYLFLTANKQDREEHGPLFHEHMHRINKAAGTKITVYHSFHDEVAHYKQHWWRCNGPCQSRKPFFGLVKRSMNRAPGPNDFWYAEHQATCSGEFIKIKEPENFKARKSKSKTKVGTTSLTKYFPKQTEESSPVSEPKVGSFKKKNKTSGLKINETGNANTSSNNVTQLTDYFSKVPPSFSPDQKGSGDKKIGSSSGIKKAGTSSIHSFSSVNNSSGSQEKVNSIKSNISGFGTGLKSNKGGTLIMNPKQSSSQNTNEKVKTPEKEKVVPFTGVGHVLGGAANRSKSILLSMFDNKASEGSSSKTGTHLDTNKNVHKSESVKNITSSKSEDECKLVLSKKTNNERLNDGSSTSKVSNRRSSISATSAASVNKDEVVVIDSDSDDESASVSENVVSCPVCGFQTLDSLINEHLDECAGLQTVLENVQIIDDDTDFDIPNRVKCPSCGYMCLEDEINVHLDTCLS